MILLFVCCCSIETVCFFFKIIIRVEFYIQCRQTIKNSKIKLSPVRSIETSMKTLSEKTISNNNSNQSCPVHSNNPITTICHSPFCNYYREMCSLCLMTDKQHRQKFHVSLQTASTYVENKLKQIEKSIVVLKKEKEEKTKTNPITLPYEVKQKLSRIREIINNKISLFQRYLEEMYERQVNMKLQSLSQTLQKSLDFLKNQLKQFQKRHYEQISLKKYFKNIDYWEHERKYYKSYMEEILQKQVKKFKQGFDDDSIMRLIVGFQGNLKNIFSQIKQNKIKENFKCPHIFLQESNQLKKYQISQKNTNDEKFILKAQFMGRPYPKQNYKWQGSPESIYYPYMDCFYIFGQGRTASNSILRYQQRALSLHNKLSFIGEMLTKRSNFSLCLMNHQIFIIGGYNDKQGCLVKCEKMVVGRKNKIYLVSSLEQRSACHSVCNFKNKYILKFGGTSAKLDESEVYYLETQMTQELYPEIYDIERQQWRVIRYNTNPLVQRNRLQFGLYPVIIIPYETDVHKILIFGNKSLQTRQSQTNPHSQNNRKQFQIRCNFTRNDVEMKIVQKSYQLNKRYVMFPDAVWLFEKKNMFTVVVADKNKGNSSLSLVEIKYQGV